MVCFIVSASFHGERTLTSHFCAGHVALEMAALFLAVGLISYQALENHARPIVAVFALVATRTAVISAPVARRSQLLVLKGHVRESRRR